MRTEQKALQFYNIHKTILQQLVCNLFGGSCGGGDGAFI